MMKLKIVQQICISFILIISINACSSKSESLMSEAVQASNNQNYRIAINKLEQIVKRNDKSNKVLEAAQLGAKIALFEIKDYAKSIFFLRTIVHKSQNYEEIKIAQIQIALIYFEQLQDYQEAIILFNKIIESDDNKKNVIDLRLKLARAYFYINNYEQSEKELNLILKDNPSEEIYFQSLQLLGNLNFSQKKYKEAVSHFTILTEKFPEKSLKDNVFLNLSVCYEELKDYKKAIDVLEKIQEVYNPKEYIKLRLKRLSERKINAPGARGLGHL